MQLQDVWSYQPYTNGVLYETEEPIDADVKWLEKRGGDERLGFPTQKPEGLLERIIRSSSKEGDMILDPFCGFGTTIIVAERLKRNWIGIDITHLAVALMKYRLRNSLGAELSAYEIFGMPTDLKGAEALAQEDRYKFQTWAVSMIEAQPARDKKGADQGIDGYIFFPDEKEGQYGKVVVQVKSGNVGASDVRDLKGTMEREKAGMAVFVTLEKPTRPMMREALAAGYFNSKYFPGRDYQRLQSITIEGLLNGLRPSVPDINPGGMFRKTSPRGKDKGKQQRLI